MRVISLLFLVILSSHIIVAQDATEKQPTTLDGISLGMTKEQVKAVFPHPTSEGYDDNLWLFDSTNISITFDDNGVVTEVISDDPNSVIIFEGLLIPIGSSMEKAAGYLGPPTKTFNTDMVSEYYFADAGVVLLTFAGEDGIALLSLTKTYDKE